jgi:hypothetical protein
VRHFDLGGGRREELQENGQQVLGNAGKWQDTVTGRTDVGRTKLLIFKSLTSL